MYNLIIVDDETKIRQGLRQHYPWEALGFKIAGDFPNGRLALDYLATHPVDVVLSDVRMPVITGLELAKSIRERGHGATIVFLSGYAEFEYARRALVHNVRDYILKPVKHEDIVSVFSAVKRELDAGKSRDEPVEESGGYYDKIVEAVEAYVAEHLKDASLEGAAMRVNMSPNYLSKVFKQHTGKNFSDYLFEAKMKKSKELMADFNLKIYHISSAVGYNNPKNFSRAFKQYHGVPPRECR